MRKALNKLRGTRQIFYSEADFQFSLAWAIKEIYQDKVDIQLEVPLSLDNNDRLDILVKIEDTKIPIELKYFHSELKFENYNLSKQNDTWRSQRVFKDLKRVETYTLNNNTKGNRQGYVILLCNEKKYWTPKKDNLTYYQFRLEEGRVIKAYQELSWITNGDSAKDNALKYGENLSFKNEYKIKWEDYSQLDIPTKGLFRYLLLEVDV